MKDRGMKKWRPFNAVVPRYELLKKMETIEIPTLSSAEIEEYEELLKTSMYTHSKVKITFVEENRLKELVDYVDNLEPIKKDVYLHTKKINFRQIIKVQL